MLDTANAFFGLCTAVCSFELIGCIVAVLVYKFSYAPTENEEQNRLKKLKKNEPPKMLVLKFTSKISVFVSMWSIPASIFRAVMNSAFFNTYFISPMVLLNLIKCQDKNNACN